MATGNVVPFPCRKQIAGSTLVLDHLVMRMRAEVLKRGGTWDEERQAQRIERIAEILASAVPISNSCHD